MTQPMRPEYNIVHASSYRALVTAVNNAWTEGRWTPVGGVAVGIDLVEEVIDENGNGTTPTFYPDDAELISSEGVDVVPEFYQAVIRLVEVNNPGFMVARAQVPPGGLNPT